MTLALLNLAFLLMLIISMKCLLPCYCNGGACTCCNGRPCTCPVMDWIASLFSSSGMSFSFGAIATTMAEGSERRFRLLPHNNVKRKSGNKSLPLLLVMSDSDGPDPISEQTSSQSP